MAARSNHPLKSLVLFAVVGVLGYLAYEYIHVRRVLSAETQEFVPVETLEKVRDALSEKFDENPCVVRFDNPQFRSRAGHYRVNLTLADGCHEQSRGLCKEVAEVVGEIVDHSVGVFAWDKAGNLITKYLD